MKIRNTNCFYSSLFDQKTVRYSLLYLMEKDDYVFWGEVIAYLRVPKKDRSLLEVGVSKFITFFEDIPVLKFPEMAREIKIKADSLKQERDQILSELKRTLFYTNYPGECQYKK